MPTSFGGRRNFTSWGVTLSCPPGAEQLGILQTIYTITGRDHGLNNIIYRDSS